MFYGTKEDQDKKVKSLVNNYRTAAQLFPPVRKVIEKFDGKVYNIRFTKALQEETNRYIYSQYHNYGNTGYIDIYIYESGNQYTIATLKKEDMEDGKRINAQKMIESARKCREDHLKRAYNLELQSEQIDIIKEQVKQIGQLLSAVTGKLDYEIREIYNLPTRLT